MKRYLTLAALLGSTALAGRDVGTIQNYGAFAAQLPNGSPIVAVHAKDRQGSMGRGIISNGRFALSMDDRIAAALSEPAPTCGNVKSTAGLRVTMIMGLAAQSARGATFRLMREAKNGTTTIRDVYVYANRSGNVTGLCTENETTARYNLNLAAGWNAVRISSNAKGSSVSIGNITGNMIPWTLSK